MTKSAVTGQPPAPHPPWAERANLSSGGRLTRSSPPPVVKRTLSKNHCMNLNSGATARGWGALARFSPRLYRSCHPGNAKGLKDCVPRTRMKDAFLLLSRYRRGRACGRSRDRPEAARRWQGSGRSEMQPVSASDSWVHGPVAPGGTWGRKRPRAHRGTSRV